MGRVDLFHSRRTNYAECVYWLRDERDSIANAAKWVAKHTPSGIFYAKQVSVHSIQNNQVGGVMMFDRNQIALETDDHIDDIQVNSIIQYNGDLWILESIQAEPHKKESQFNREIDYRYILSLRR